jgi:hypothetical protein
MNYLAPLLFAGILVLLGALAFLWVWWRDKRELKRFANRYQRAMTDSVDSPQPHE